MDIILGIIAVAMFMAFLSVAGAVGFYFLIKYLSE